jgi:16S rRNA (uracil1498-N3)-methyltransferase
MNLLLLDAAEVAPDGTARLGGRRARHAVEVLRVEPGDRLAVGVVGGRIGAGEVLAISASEVVLRVAIATGPPPPSPVSLLLALPRPKILRKVLQATASMGVKRLVLVGSWRVEKSYFASPLLAPAAIEAELRLGLEQGRDTVLPEVLVRRLFKPFVEDELDALLPARERLIADPGARETLDAHPPAARARPVRPLPDAPDRGARAPAAGLTPDAAAATLAIGPEGGFTPYEAGALERRGFRPFSLGPRALRVDVAVPFAVGQAEQWLRRVARPETEGQPAASSV